MTDTEIKQLQDKQEALIIHWKNSPNITGTYTLKFIGKGACDILLSVNNYSSV